ncbi:MAG: hypothetical protein EBU46_00350 [Nitrosomonadaceae bacterium]|nr:hypothetical protein [Nitrosomonadaceae bacterium]
MKAELQQRLESLMKRFAAPYDLELQTVIDNQQQCLKGFADALGVLRAKMTAKIGPDEEFLPEEEKTDTRLTKEEFTQWLATLNLVQLHLLRIFLWETFIVGLSELIHIHTMLGGLHNLLMELNSQDPAALDTLATEVDTALKQIENLNQGKISTETLTRDDSPFVRNCNQVEVITLMEAQVTMHPTLNVNQLLYINLLTPAVRKMVAAIDRAATSHLRMGTEMVHMSEQIGKGLTKIEDKEGFVSGEQREKVAELQKSLEIMGKALMHKFSAEFLFQCSKADLLLLYTRLKLSATVVGRIKEMSKGAVQLPTSEDVEAGLKAVGMALADLGVHNLPVPSNEELNDAARTILRSMQYPIDNDGESDGYDTN